MTTQLRKIIGVGSITALTSVLTVDNPERFAQPRDIGPYLGLVTKRDFTAPRGRHARCVQCPALIPLRITAILTPSEVNDRFDALKASLQNQTILSSMNCELQPGVEHMRLTIQSRHDPVFQSPQSRFGVVSLLVFGG